MPLPRHAKPNRVMSKECGVKGKSGCQRKVSSIKDVGYAHNIISFFQKAMSQRCENRRCVFVICSVSSQFIIDVLRNRKKL